MAGVALLASILARAQSGEKTLYFLTGSPSPKSASTYPATLYSFDRAAGALRTLRTVAPPDQGTEFINALPDYRLLVVASPHVRPTHFEVISMDAPLLSRAFDIDPGPLSFISAALLDTPNRGLYEAIFLAHGDRTRVVAANLLQPAALLDTQTLTPEDFRYVRLGGLSGGAQGGSDVASGRLEGAELEAWLAGRWVDLAAAPPEMQVARGKDVSIPAVNKDLVAVIQPAGDQETERQVAVYSKARNRWSTLALPGSDVWIRAFGPWLVASAAEPLNGRRNPGYGLRRFAASKNGPAVEEQFEQSGLYFTGKLVFYDSRVNRSIILETGQADSEVLAMDDSSVVYRVNNALFEAHFDNGRLTKPVRLIEDELLADVHWGFFGPEGH